MPLYVEYNKSWKLNFKRKVDNNCVLFRTKAQDDENPSSLFAKKKEKKEREKYVVRKHVKIRITCYNADTVLSELDNIVTIMP